MKILVCGSAGLTMSNLLRYMLYHDEEKIYKFASIDKLEKPEDYKNIYVNYRHHFYIGDVLDEKLLKRVAYIEKPKIIINGINGDAKAILESYHSLKKNIPNALILQLGSPLLKDYSINSIYQKALYDIVMNDKNIFLSIPKIFGFRDRHGIVINLIRKMINGEPLVKIKRYEEMVYAEDVASKIWYTIENREKNYINMPPLGKLSSFNIAYVINNIFNLNYSIQKNKIKDIITENTNDWRPDSKNIEEALIKTVRWFSMNRWAI